jgi:hypothetical protein
MLFKKRKRNFEIKKQKNHARALGLSLAQTPPTRSSPQLAPLDSILPHLFL